MNTATEPESEASAQVRLPSSVTLTVSPADCATFTTNGADEVATTVPVESVRLAVAVKVVGTAEGESGV